MRVGDRGCQMNRGRALCARPGRRLLLVAQMASLGAVSCREPDNSDTEVCPRAEAAFDLRVTAVGGSVPVGTRISVTYGGATTEHYVVGEGHSSNQASLCCVDDSGEGLSLHPAHCGESLADASVPNSPLSSPTQVRCLIWSNGAADVIVEARGYPLVAQTLAAEEDESYPECGAWDTALTRVELSRLDAGASGL